MNRFEISRKIDDLILKNIHRFSRLVNSESTSRWYWSTLQAECMHLITSTIIELQEIQTSQNGSWNKETKDFETIDVFAAYLKHLEMTITKRKSQVGGWSNRQLEIALEGGPIFAPKVEDDEDEEAEDFRQYLGYGGQRDGMP